MDLSGRFLEEEQMMLNFRDADQYRAVPMMLRMTGVGKQGNLRVEILFTYFKLLTGKLVYHFKFFAPQSLHTLKTASHINFGDL